MSRMTDVLIDIRVGNASTSDNGAFSMNTTHSKSFRITVTNLENDIDLSMAEKEAVMNIKHAFKELKRDIEMKKARRW